MQTRNKGPVAAVEILQIRAAEKIRRLYEKPLVLVGSATCGLAAGSAAVLEAFRRTAIVQGIDLTVVETGCYGHCYAEPMALVYKPGFQGVYYGYLDEGKASRIVTDYIAGDDPCLEFVLAAVEGGGDLPAFSDFPRGELEHRVITSNCGLLNPGIDHYLACGGYWALAIALGASPESVTGEVSSSGLRGRGGAGYPTGLKWERCYREPGPRYIICNADEGDPGAFMDRAILESDPHQLLEGLAIAAHAVEARKGYLYIRSEYPLAVDRMREALSEAYEYGLLGENMLGSGHSLDLELFRGSGAFVCGEETALLASIQGEPGLPRHRPPYPSEKGLFGHPTVINNVKTLAYLPHIVKKGAGWFKSIGAAQTPGTVVFALAGKVVNTGLVEVPSGTPLRKVVFEAGSGIPNQRQFKSVQIGGPSGGCLPEESLDIPLDYLHLSLAGTMMGSGGLVVMDQDDCMVEVARYFLDFTQKESCGKCTFCRLGTRQMLLILERITRGEGLPEDLELLAGLAETIREGSLCGLGKTAPNPVISTLAHFRGEYNAHIIEKRCPSLMCRDLISYVIMPDKCERSCDACVGSCPTEAIYSTESRIKAINQSKCTKCNSCLVACPPRYSAIIKVSPPIAFGKGNES